MTRPLVLVIAAYEERGGLQLRWRRQVARLSAERDVVVLTWARTWRPSSRREGRIRVVTLPALADWGRDHDRRTEVVNTAVSVATGVIACLWLRRRWAVAVGGGLHPEGTVVALAASLLRRPFLADTWLVGPLGNVARARGSTGGRAALGLLRRARAVLCATDVAAEELRDAGIPADRVVRTPLELRLDDWPARTGPRHREPGERRRVVYAGRFDLRQKRLDLLLQAWSSVGEGWELLLVGGGPDDAAVRELARRCPMPADVTGWTRDVGAVLRDADAFVLPTSFESPGYALFEGMACGLPGLASDIDVYRELAPTGVRLVDPSAAAWAEALGWITRLPDRERHALGVSARRWVEIHAGDGARHLAELIDR